MPGDLVFPIEPVDVNAALLEQADADQAEARHWTEELRRIDPTLSVVWVPENATEHDDPGRWHLRKEIPGDYDEYWPLLTATGGYKAPGSWLLDTLTANDMWNPRVHRSKQEAKAKHREAKRRAIARETEQRQDEMALANRAARRLKGDSGFKKRTDLILPKAIADERKAQREVERKAA